MIFGSSIKHKQTTVTYEIFSLHEETIPPCQEWLHRRFTDSYAHNFYHKDQQEYKLRNFRSYLENFPARRTTEGWMKKRWGESYETVDFEGWRGAVKVTFEYDVTSEFAYNNFKQHIALGLWLHEDYNNDCEDKSMMVSHIQLGIIS